LKNEVIAFSVGWAKARQLYRSAAKYSPHRAHAEFALHAAERVRTARTRFEHAAKIGPAPLRTLRLQMEHGYGF